LTFYYNMYFIHYQSQILKYKALILLKKNMLIFEAKIVHCLLQNNYFRQYILMNNMLSNDLLQQPLLQTPVPLSAFIGWGIHC